MISTICPEEIRIANHKKGMKKMRNNKRWRQVRDPWIKANPICYYCRKPSQAPHHPERTPYGTDAYYDLSDCIPACNACHRAYDKGLVFCCTDPNTGKNHYRPKDAEYCPICRPPEEVERIEQWKASRLFKVRQIRNRINANNRAFYQQRKVRT